MKLLSKTIVFLILLFASSFPLVSALGIGPGYVGIDFSPGITRDMTFVAINNGAEDMIYKVYASGEISQYITCSDQFIDLDVGEKQYFTCTITLPSALAPGANEGRIGIIESKSVAEGQISVLSAVESRIVVNVPYPDFYLAMTLYANNVKINEKETFKVKVKNWGKDAVTLKIPISVISSDGKVMATATTNQATIEPLREAELTADWIANIPSAKYTALADYQGFNSSADFFVGDYLINIMNLSADINKGELGKFDLYLQSMWPDPITFKSEIEVFDILGNSQGVKEDELIIRSWESGAFKILWDKPINESGEYTANVTISYGNKTSQEDFKFRVKDKSIASSMDKDKLVIYGLSAVVFVLVVVILWKFLILPKILLRKGNIKIKKHFH